MIDAPDGQYTIKASVKKALLRSDKDKAKVRVDRNDSKSMTN